MFFRIPFHNIRFLSIKIQTRQSCRSINSLHSSCK
nr:MAG TPA: hypothetical protein [Caudoviricetes sp.]